MNNEKQEFLQNSLGYTCYDFGTATAYNVNGSIQNEITYTGVVYDSSTGLYYMNARYYDSEIGRFISQDTYRGEKNDAGTWHLYNYCANDPINYVDPSGHWVETVLDAASIGYLANELRKNPSLKNAGYLLWDVAGAAIPFVRGSYVAKGHISQVNLHVK